MGVQVNELTFLNSMAEKFAIPTPDYITAEASQAAIKSALARWGHRALVKPDILAGKRGKAGKIEEVHDPRAALLKLRALAAAELGGKIARTSYLVQYIPAKMEVYSALLYDSRTLSPVMTLSLHGGVDIESVPQEQKRTIEIDVFKGLNAYQAQQALQELACPADLISPLARALVSLWDLFIASGMTLAEVNPWRVTPEGRIYACDFKGVLDEANYHFGDVVAAVPEYPAGRTDFEEAMAEWNAASHQGQAHVADLGGKRILPLLFGGGASTIIIETLLEHEGDPVCLSDFGGNPPYERMYGTAKLCFEHRLAGAKLLLILGGKANNTLIDVTFQAIADALRDYCDRNGPVHIPVVIGRGGPRLIQGMLAMRQTLEALRMPYVMFGPDTPITMVAEYAARLCAALDTLAPGGA